MRSTFTNTGYLPPDRRDTNGNAWVRGEPGEMILQAYDRLSPLASSVS